MLPVLRFLAEDLKTSRKNSKIRRWPMKETKRHSDRMLAAAETVKSANEALKKAERDQRRVSLETQAEQLFNQHVLPGLAEDSLLVFELDCAPTFQRLCEEHQLDVHIQTESVGYGHEVYYPFTRSPMLMQVDGPRSCNLTGLCVV